MTIYECLGIDHILLDQEIPKDLILENIGNEDLRVDAEFHFRVIDQVTLRASISRGEHYLQVLEIQLNSPDYIREISFAIQKAIKYRVLFVFVYEGRYLLVRRSFNLTMSTENVYTYNASFCSDWIYEEYLHLDILYNHRFRAVAEYAEADEEAVAMLKTDGDKGDYILFKDLLSSAERLNKCIIESECISTRWLIDWINIHVAGHRVELGDFIDRIQEREAYLYVGDYLFIDKSSARYAMSALDNTDPLHTLGMDHTGKSPMRYFEGIRAPATFDDAEVLDHAIQYGSDDIIYLELQSHRSEERRRLDDEYKRFVEEKRRESARRKSIENRRIVDEGRNAWEQLHLDLESLSRHNDPEDISDESNLDEDKHLEFEDISFCIYDKNSIHIEFCNFEVEDDGTVYMVFWANNQTLNDIKLWAIEVNIDGEQDSCWVYTGLVKSRNSAWCKVKLNDISSEGGYTVDCLFEIDDTDNCGFDSTQRVSVEVDFDDCTQSAELLDEEEQEDPDDDDEDIEFEDIEFVVYDNDDVYVEFCNFEIENGKVFLNFWVRNESEETINVFAQDIYVDGVKILDYLSIGEFEPDECEYGRFNIPQVTPTTCYGIKAYIEIDDEDCNYIDSADPFVIEVDFCGGTLSAKSSSEIQAEEQRHLEEELRRAEEQRRLEEERRKADEQRRLEEERRRAEEHRLEEERRRAEEQRRLEEERRRAEEQRRLEEERRRAEEQRRLEEECRRAEEQRLLEEERLRIVEFQKKQPYVEQLVQVIDGARHSSIQRLAIVLNSIYMQCADYDRYLRMQEEQRKQAEKQRKAAEQLRLEEERRRAEEQRRLQEEHRKAEEQRRLEEERRRAEEQRRLEEERCRAEEQRRLEEERRRAEEQRRLEEERRRIEEQRRLAEAMRKADEQRRREEEITRRRESFRAQKLCQHCGGKFKGLFFKSCSICGRKKD